MHADRGFPQPVDHLPYFIDRADQDWQNPGSRPQERPYFLFVGRLEKIKGLHTLINIWNQVPDYDLLVIGAGNQAAELRVQARENPRIKFLGPRPQNELGNLYYHSLATIVPSITYETFGIIIVESFARKAPVIVRNLGALPEVVRDSQGGIIYHTDDELLKAINKIGGSKVIRSELGEKGYQAFLKYWCREAHIKLYFELLGNIAINKYGELPWQ
jgi:glycosyltransferase involved in cell wall biosynthesis